MASGKMNCETPARGNNEVKSITPHAPTSIKIVQVFHSETLGLYGIVSIWNIAESCYIRPKSLGVSPNIFIFRHRVLRPIPKLRAVALKFP